MKTVWVAERGCYDSRHIVGIFDSPERAMGAFPGLWTKTTWTHYPNWPRLDGVTHWVSWSNGLDWDDLVEIREEDFTDEGAVREADVKVVQTLRTDGRWDYISEIEKGKV